jgi:hypothetical protein
MVLRAGFKKKLSLYVELKIYDKNRQKITGPQCVNCFLYKVIDELMLLSLFLKMRFCDRNTNGKKQHVQNKLAL